MVITVTVCAQSYGDIGARIGLLTCATAWTLDGLTFFSLPFRLNLYY